MITIHWVTGLTCVGKTTYIGQMSREGVGVLYVGKMCRKEYGEDEIANQQDAITPELTEEYVRDLIFSAVNKLGKERSIKGSILYVDGFPRSKEQCDWITKFFPEAMNVITVCVCPEYLRQKRIANRTINLQKEGKDSKLLSIRVDQDIKRISDVIFYAMSNAMKIQVINTADFNYLRSMSDVSDRMSRMFTCMKILSDKVMERYEVNMSMVYESNKYDSSPISSIGTLWALKFLSALESEIQEIKQILPNHFWSFDTLDMVKIREEVVDVFHFLISLSLAIGMDDTLLYSMFLEKFKVNIVRQDEGYTKLDKDLSPAG